MSYTPIFSGKIEKGQFKADQSMNYKMFLGKNEGKRVNVTVSTEKRTRSNEQNRYYWGVIIPMVYEALQGMTEEDIDKLDVHEVLKRRFLLNDVPITIEKERIFYTRSTKSLTTVGAEQYFSDIRNWASVYLHIYIPEPNEVSIE